MGVIKSISPSYSGKKYQCKCHICGDTFVSMRRFSSRCSVKCVNKQTLERMKKYKINHPEKYKQTARSANIKYNKSHAISIKERNKRWMIKNAEKVKFYKKNEYQKHRSAYKLRKSIRKHCLKETVKLIGKDGIFKRMNIFNGCCFCNQKTSLTIEHLIPISKSGDNSEGNIFGSCHSCNSSKHTHDWKDWFRKQPFYELTREIEIENLRFLEKVAVNE